MNFKKSLSVIFISLLCFCANSGVCSAQDKMLLKLVYKKGDVNNTRVTMDQKISQTIQGKQMDVAQVIGMGYKMEVQDVDQAGVASIKVTYHTILFKQQGPGGNVEYDSSKPTATIDPAAKAYAFLAGESFAMKMDPRGHIVEVQGIDQIRKHMIEKMEIAQESQRMEVEKNMKATLNDDVLKETMEKMMAIYPENPVGIGDSWNKEVVLTKLFPMIVNNTWTLKDRKNGVVIIDVKSKVKPNPDAAPMKMGAVSVQYSIGGEQNGTIELRGDTGWVARGKLTQALSGEIIMTQAQGTATPESASWPISMDSVVTVEPF